MARRGRRPGLSAGYGLGVIGAVIAIGATVAGIVPLLMLGMFLIGFGNSSNQLSRYVGRRHVPVPPPRGHDRHDRLGGDGRGGPRPDADRAVRGPRGGARAATADRRLPRPDPVRRDRRHPLVRPAPAGPVRARRRASTTRRRPGTTPGAGAHSPAHRRRRPRRPAREPGRDGPDHDDDAGPHDGPRPPCRGGRARDQRPHVRHVRPVAVVGSTDRPVRQPHDHRRGAHRDARRRRSSPRSRRPTEACCCSSRCSCSATAGTSASWRARRCSRTASTWRTGHGSRARPTR